jgi:hypothetical protein
LILIPSSLALLENSSDMIPPDVRWCAFAFIIADASNQHCFHRNRPPATARG